MCLVGAIVHFFLGSSARRARAGPSLEPSKKIDSLYTGTTYTFRVRAVHDADKSAWSSLTFTTPNTTMPPIPSLAARPAEGRSNLGPNTTSFAIAVKRAIDVDAEVVRADPRVVQVETRREAIARASDQG